MKRLLVIAFVVFSMALLYAHAQQPDMAKLKADAQKVVSIISGDKAKLQTYCQINDLGDQIGEADQQKDRKKAEALVEKMNGLEKQLGPEYLALVDATKDVDPNSEEGQEIESLFANLDVSCPH
jgi:hypothetical protein